MAKLVSTRTCYALFLGFGLLLGVVALISNDGAYACISSIAAMSISAFGMFLIETHQPRATKQA